MEILQPAAMAAPKGHYAPGIKHGGLVYVSGQLPLGADGNVVSGGIETQTQCCLENMALILKEGGGSLGRVLKLNIFISDIAHWPAVNTVVARLFGEHRPARIVVPVGQLNYGCLVEIDAIAFS
jgi:2-iminobutanoate/2-iminopropanoate deaminase